MSGKWCDFVCCEEIDGGGPVRWKPKAGNAIFWENLDGDGRRVELGGNLGLPMLSGSKTGLNIWTRERENEDWKWERVHTAR